MTEPAASPKKHIVIIHVDNEATPLEEMQRALTIAWKPSFGLTYIPIEGGRVDLNRLMQSNKDLLPDILIVDMKMFHVDQDPEPHPTYYEDTKEGKRLVEDFCHEVGGKNAGRVKIMFLTQLSKWSPDVKGLEIMNYEVLYKDNFLDAVERVKEVAVRLASPS